MKYQIGEKVEKVQAEALAIEVALLGGNRVSPNPMVGCVILNSEFRLLATGYHQKYGESHAEVNAFRGLTPEQVRGSHVFVSLEPCAHHGKTPPCADLIAQFPIAKVYYGTKDPHPLVAGEGIQKIKASGIEVEEFSQANKKAVHESLEIFFFHLQNKRSFFALKTAISRDEKIADAQGESKWITNSTSRNFVHSLRARFQGILIGKHTLLKDDPQLTIRHSDYPDFENTVIILDAEGDSLNNIAKSQVYKLRKPEQILLCLREAHLPRIDLEQIENSYYRHKPTGIGILAVEETAQGEFFLADLAQKLYDLEIFSVFIEGGARVYESFLKARLVDRIYLFQAEKILGKDGISWNSQGNAILKNYQKTDERNFDGDEYSSYQSNHPSKRV